MRPEPDEVRGAAPLAAAEVAQVGLAPRAHLGRRGVAEVRVVRPHDGLCVVPEKVQEPDERPHHVGVAEVPRAHAAVEHLAVVRLGVADDAGVLGRAEKGERLGRPALAVGREPEPLAEEVLEHRHHLALVGVEPSAGDGAAVVGGVVAVGREASVARARRLGEVGVAVVEVAEDLGGGRVEAVHVEPEKTRAVVLVAARVPVARPLDIVADLLVAPHPGREARERLPLRLARVAMADVGVDALGVGPVGLGGDDTEPFLLDERACNPGAEAVELARPVARLPDADHAAVADPVEERAEVDVLDTPERLGVLGDERGELGRRPVDGGGVGAWGGRGGVAVGVGHGRGGRRPGCRPEPPRPVPGFHEVRPVHHASLRRAPTLGSGRPAPTQASYEGGAVAPAHRPAPYSALVFAVRDGRAGDPSTPGCALHSG